MNNVTSPAAISDALIVYIGFNGSVGFTGSISNCPFEELDHSTFPIFCAKTFKSERERFVSSQWTYIELGISTFGRLSIESSIVSLTWAQFSKPSPVNVNVIGWFKFLSSSEGTYIGFKVSLDGSNVPDPDVSQL